LAALTSKRRKETRRERRKVIQQDIQHRWVSGGSASDDDIQFVYSCYQKTFNEYGNQPSLSKDFWQAICDKLNEKVQFCIASHAGHNIASAIFLRSATHLYGRYWGAITNIDCLHFETCFYQGIDYCIEHNIQVFEPGAGGGHKLNRGFLPQTIYTAHWIADTKLRALLNQMASLQTQFDLEGKQSIGQHSPFNQNN